MPPPPPPPPPPSCQTDFRKENITKRKRERERENKKGSNSPKTKKREMDESDTDELVDATTTGGRPCAHVVSCVDGRWIVFQPSVVDVSAQ